jgi:hypothetical protein
MPLLLLLRFLTNWEGGNLAGTVACSGFLLAKQRKKLLRVLFVPISIKKLCISKLNVKFNINDLNSSHCFYNSKCS